MSGRAARRSMRRKRRRPQLAVVPPGLGAVLFGIAVANAIVKGLRLRPEPVPVLEPVRRHPESFAEVVDEPSTPERTEQP